MARKQQRRESPNAQTSTAVRRIVAYTLILMAFALVFFVMLLVATPNLDVGEMQTATAGSLQRIFAMVTALMFVGGVLGGCLYNFRGLTKHAAEDNYSENYNLSYYLRPISGGISGLIVFFLLLGGAITFNLGAQSGGIAWVTLQGRMPYVAFSLLAGYGSNEFMLKLKDLADSLFALSKNKGGS
jgi:hypothetical protein